MEYWIAFDDYFGKVVNFTRNNGIKLLVVQLPDYWQFDGTFNTKPNMHVNELCVRHNVPYLDLIPVFRNDGNIDMIYLRPWNNHLSRYGNHVVAKSIMSKLIQEDLINQ